MNCTPVVRILSHRQIKIELNALRVLREHEAGAKTTDLARKHCISEATPYNWKAKYGGLEVSEAQRLRTPRVPRSSNQFVLEN
jgi:transposase